MDFRDNEEEAKFRSQVKNWLYQNSRDFESIDFRNISQHEEVQYSRQWMKRKSSAGYASLLLPPEYGGMNGSAVQCAIFSQEEKKFNLPYNYFDITLGMAVPTMLAYASESHKSSLIPKIYTGEHIWCQLFSEPAVGSDLAGLYCKAEKDGEDWVINGQKVWTTHAHIADYGLILLRTAPEKPKHSGLTFFFIDMKSPGIEVRPIRQIDNKKEFNEVFFTNVKVSDSQRLGEVNEGFKTALHTLLFERQSATEQSLGLIEFEDMLNLFQSPEISALLEQENSIFQKAIADWYLIKEGLRYFGYRQLSIIESGKTPGPEAAIAKLLEAKGAQDAIRLSLDTMGYSSVVKSSEHYPSGNLFQMAYLRAPGLRIAGGTDEILRNTIAEQVLKLPKEPRTDKDIPFRDLQY